VRGGALHQYRERRAAPPSNKIAPVAILAPWCHISKIASNIDPTPFKPLNSLLLLEKD
jgi:hypothetical protein